MTNNEILRKLCVLFDIDANQIIHLISLNKRTVSHDYAAGLLTKKNRSTYIECQAEDLIDILNGLITQRRGPSPNTQSTSPSDNNSPKAQLTYNALLKKLRVALNLHEKDIIHIFALGNIELGRNDVNSLFRNEQHKHFRPCSSRFFSAFLDGLKQYKKQKDHAL